MYPDTEVFKREKFSFHGAKRDSVSASLMRMFETRGLDLIKFLGWAIIFFVISYITMFSYFPNVVLMKANSNRARNTNISPLLSASFRKLWLPYKSSSMMSVPSKNILTSYSASKEMETTFAMNDLHSNRTTNGSDYPPCTISPPNCTCFCSSNPYKSCDIQVDDRSHLVAIDRFKGRPVLPKPGCLNLTDPDRRSLPQLSVDSNHGLKCYPARTPKCSNFYESSALVAIVIPSAPRHLYSQAIHFYNLSGSATQLTYYLHPTFTLNAVPFLILMPIPLEDIAISCSMLLECHGFTADGKLFSASEVQVSHLEKGDPRSDRALYTKRPISSVPQPFLDRVSGLWRIPDSSVKGNEEIATIEEPRSIATMYAKCNATPHCHHFRLSDGKIFRKSVSSTFLEFMMERGSHIYFRDPPGPTDYVVGTVMRILEEMQHCMTPKFRGRVHLYVADTSPQGPNNAVEFLADRYASLPCATFFSARDYGRLAEAALPSDARGVPPEGQRTEVNQLLDYVSAIETVIYRSPNAALLLWEDDSSMCPGTLELLDSAVTTALGCSRSAQWAASSNTTFDWHSPVNTTLCESVAAADPKFGIFKIGHGGSGLFLHPRIVHGVVTYLKVRRGYDNVDVGIWKYCEEFDMRQYMANKVWSSHRGQRSSFRQHDTFDWLWPAVDCQAELVEQWGHYIGCSAAEFTGNWKCIDYTKTS